VSDVSDRVVQVFVPVGMDGLGRTGTGYLIGDGLVLTARHVIANASGSCEVRGLGMRGWVSATVLWCGDGALLHVDAAFADVDRVRLGRLVGDERAGCEATGFPWAQLERRDDVPVRKSEHLVGEIDRFSGQEPDVATWMLTVHVGGSVPDPREDGASPWAGMSGAGLVCSGLLVGVVVVDPARFGQDRLLAVPLTRLVGLASFADRVADGRGEPVVLEVVEAQGVLERAYDPPPPRRERQSSAFLLGARYGVVQFRARPELERLRDWAGSGQEVAVGVLTGPGGVGKTRLARELCRRLAAEGWVGGPLASRPEPGLLSRLARVDEAVLVVVDDYAEARRGDVVALLEQLARGRQSGRPRRLLLSARQLGDWWTELQDDCTDSEVRDLLGSALTIELGAAEEGADDRLDAYRAAIAAYAPHTGPALTAAVVPDLADRLFETLLFVHLAALSALPGGGDPPSTPLGSIRAELLARTLQREQRYWSRIAKATDPPLLIDRHVQGRAVAVATLAASTTTDVCLTQRHRSRS